MLFKQCLCKKEKKEKSTHAYESKTKKAKLNTTVFQILELKCAKENACADFPFYLFLLFCRVN